MKNLLFTIITILLIVLTVIVIAKGITIGKLELFSLSQIKEKSANLKALSQTANDLNMIQYNQNLSNLQKAQKKLASAKSGYLDIASISSDDEIKEANQTQTYAMEYLWSRIGNHATEKGVNLKLDIAPTGVENKHTMEFTVEGSYQAIIEFIYSLENEEGFRIYNFKITSGVGGTSATGEKLTATFTVMDVGIKEEKITTEVQNENATNTTTASENTTSNQ